MEQGATETLEDFRRKVIDFISSVEYSELVTVANNVPHIRPMVYVNNGLKIYMATRKGAVKIQQIIANPHVSVIIIKSFKENEDTKEAIIEGLAGRIIDEVERNWVFEAFRQKPRAFQEWAEQGNTDDYEVIKIEPETIKYFDYARGESAPAVLKINE